MLRKNILIELPVDKKLMYVDNFHALECLLVHAFALLKPHDNAVAINDLVGSANIMSLYFP